MSKRIVISNLIKNINVTDRSLIIELESGILTIEKPKHIWFYDYHWFSGVFEQKDVYIYIGLIFLLLVLGVFMDYFNIISLVEWYGVILFIAGVHILVALIAPRRKVLIIETDDKTFYFTKAMSVDTSFIKEIVLKLYSLNKSDIKVNEYSIGE